MPLFYKILLSIWVLNAYPVLGSSVRILVNKKGEASVHVKIVTENKNVPFYQMSDEKFGVIFVALPFSFEETSLKTITPETLTAQIHQENDYTLIILVFPNKFTQIEFFVDHIASIKKRAKNRFRLEFDFSFSSMSNIEHQLVSFSDMSDFDLIVDLPRKYEEDEVNFRYLSPVNENPRRYFVSAATISENKTHQIWIEFPSPEKNKSKIITLFIFALIGASPLLFFEIDKFQNRKIYWYVSLFFISTLILCMLFYVAFVLSDGFEILVSTATAIPSTIFLVGCSLYFMLVNNFYSIVEGRITVEGKIDKYIDQFSEVILYRIDKNEFNEIKRQKNLKNGRYTFSFRQEKQSVQYFIKVICPGTKENQGLKFEISQREKKVLKNINLQWLRPPT